jgi:hypothetical protein
VGFRESKKLGVPSTRKYESPAWRVRAGKGVAVGTAVGEGVTRALPVGATEVVAARAGDTVDAGAQPDRTTQRPIAKAGNLHKAFPPLPTEPS